MSNLSELLPSGGGAKSATFVASGTLPNGKPVILKTNGQVELVALSPVTESIPSGSASVFHTSSVEYATVAYDPNTANKFITVYKNSTTTYGTAVVGTVSGNSISFGTPTVFNTAATNYIEIAFDPYTADKFAIVYSNAGNSGAGTAIVGAVSGTSLTFGSPQVFNTGFTGLFGFAFDSNTVNRLLVTYYDAGNSNYGTALSGLIFSTNLISWGSEVVFNSATTINTEVQFDPNTAQKFVVSYKDNGNNAYGTTKVGTLSGSAISFNGAAHVFNPASTGEFISLSFDPNTANKFVVAYLDAANSNYGTAIVGTVSGTSISYGSEYVFNAGSTSYISVRFNPNTANQFVIVYNDTANSQHGTAIVGTVSGTAISFGSEYVFNSAATIYTRISFDPNTIGKFVINYYNGGNTDGEAILGQLVAPSLTNLTSTNFLGITDEAIASGASGSVVVEGGVGAGQTSLTIGSTYYVQTNGTISTVSTSPAVNIGKALSATTILLKG